MEEATKSISNSEKESSRKYSLEEWEAQKNNVELLYLKEGKTLKEVLKILEEDFHFVASEKQLKSRLPKWGFDVKNLKGDTMVQIARMKAKRRIENKDSSFRMHKKPVDERKIDRYLKRNEISEEKLLSMPSPANALSPAFSIFTPRSIRSTSAGLNFDSLSIENHQASNSVSPPSENKLSTPHDLRTKNFGHIPEDLRPGEDIPVDLQRSFCEMVQRLPRGCYHVRMWLCHFCEKSWGSSTFNASCLECGYYVCDECPIQVACGHIDCAMGFMHLAYGQ